MHKVGERIKYKVKNQKQTKKKRKPPTASKFFAARAHHITSGFMLPSPRTVPPNARIVRYLPNSESQNKQKKRRSRVLSNTRIDAYLLNSESQKNKKNVNHTCMQKNNERRVQSLPHTITRQKTPTPPKTEQMLNAHVPPNTEHPTPKNRTRKKKGPSSPPPSAFCSTAQGQRKIR